MTATVETLPLTAPHGSTTDPAAARVPHLWQLDVLRGVAIVMVFAYHLLGTAYGEDFALYRPSAAGWLVPSAEHRPTLWAFYPYQYGQYGVVLFFVLSGFCIHHATLRRAGASPAASRDLRLDFRAFLVRRAWRLYPAYLIVLVGGYLALRARDPARAPGVTDLLLHALMLHNLRPASFFSINSSLWSLAVEWQFYLAYPLFLAMRRRWGAAAAVAVPLALSIAYTIATEVTGAARGPRALVWNNLPVWSWYHWCLGALVAERWNDGRRLFRVGAPALACAWLALLVAAAYDPIIDVVSYLLPFGFAATVESYLHAARAPRLHERALVVVGLSSYSLYLVHRPLLAPALRAVRAAVPLPPSPWLDLTAVGAAVLAVLVGVSWACYGWVERPGINFGRRLARRAG